MTVFSTRLAGDGFVVVNDVIDDVLRDQLALQLVALESIAAGSRLLLDRPWCTELAQQLRRHAVLKKLLPVDAVAVQCTLFDKSPTKNWLAALHQDLSIPVKSRVDHAGCSGWSEKEGQVYVQPPAKVLEPLVAVRIHIDDCPEEGGALRVVPKSHSQGRLDQGRADMLREQYGETVVPVARGGALVMRPLLLHASSKAVIPRLRRVLHFVFGPRTLPFGLEWQWAV
jgi:ectoine hydroxylase-related dioxygenase (phytanoyl-CoA dioxygenase family)